MNANRAPSCGFGRVGSLVLGGGDVWLYTVIAGWAWLWHHRILHIYRVRRLLRIPLIAYISVLCRQPPVPGRPASRLPRLFSLSSSSHGSWFLFYNAYQNAGASRSETLPARAHAYAPLLAAHALRRGRYGCHGMAPLNSSSLPTSAAGHGHLAASSARVPALPWGLDGLRRARATLSP